MRGSYYMKVRLLAVMAVVVVGVMAGTSPAMAKKAHTASAWSHQHADNKAFGEAIYKLRKSNDLTNFSVAQITAASVQALTALKDGLTKVADATTEFKYGVVQVATNASAGQATGAGTTPAGLGNSVAGLGPTHFYATPPIYKTGEQSTVTFAIKNPAPAALGSMGFRLYTAVRSVYPDKGVVACRITVTNNVTGDQRVTAVGAGSFASGGSSPFKTMVQSPIKPEAPNENNATFPAALVEAEGADRIIDLLTPEFVAASASGADKTRFEMTGTANTGVTALGTLSCLRTS